MVLKEAYRYQNYLESLINKASGFLLSKDFTTSTKETHNRKKSNPDAENETITVAKSQDLEFTPTNLVDFIEKAISEKEKLSNAIVDAKRHTEIDIDSSISLNKIKQNYMNILNNMAKTKSSESIKRGSDYKFNNEGEQVSYYYSIDSVTTIDYDRNDIKKLIKKYKKETDEISTKLDVIELTTKVDYTPVWDVDSDLEDIVVS